MISNTAVAPYRVPENGCCGVFARLVPSGEPRVDHALCMSLARLYFLIGVGLLFLPLAGALSKLGQLHRP